MRIVLDLLLDIFDVLPNGLGVVLGRRAARLTRLRQAHRLGYLVRETLKVRIGRLELQGLLGLLLVLGIRLFAARLGLDLPLETCNVGANRLDLLLARTQIALQTTQAFVRGDDRGKKRVRRDACAERWLHAAGPSAS